jgi:uncharacterized OsmC-like protein
MKNINLNELTNFVEKAKNDKTLLEKEVKIEVNWNFDEELPQMSCTLNYSNNQSTTFYIDQIPSLGGKGLAPNPIQYCLIGLGSCFLSTFAIVCSQMNLNVKKLKLIIKNKLNLSIPLNLGNEPITKGIEFEIEIESDEDMSKIEAAKETAVNLCPAVWCMKNPIPINVNIKAKELKD